MREASGIAPPEDPGAEPSPLLENLLELPRMLRRVGLPISLDQVLNYSRALGWVDLGRQEQVFHASRATLVLRREDLDLFGSVFHQFWRFHRNVGRRVQKAPDAPRHDRKDPRPNVVQLMAARAGVSDPEIETVDRSGTASDQEVLQRKDFGAMTPAELTAVKRLIEDLRWRVSERRTRRWETAGRGSSLHLRQMLRDVARYGASPRLAYRRRTVKERPVVLLADVSGSMERYSRLILQFFFSVAQSLGSVESFVFGTRLSRVTPELRLRNIDRALGEAGRRVQDWSGGTRIGASLEAFNRHWARRVLRRGAVVVIVSDGWERGDPRTLSAALRYLQRRCHRLIWLNPLSGRTGYRPVVRGMAAALPFIDDFLPVHNLQSLHQLAKRLSCLPQRRSARRGSTVAPPSPATKLSATKDSATKDSATKDSATKDSATKDLPRRTQSRLLQPQGGSTHEDRRRL